ncbi:serpin family protein [Candidatus Woesearchaeota archaeon]|nr:serpin family protein [Candidatus Woesearchaeota archaeon]
MGANTNLIGRAAVILLILSALLLSLGCQGTVVPLADDSQASEQDVVDVVNSNNDFAFELYSELNDDDNIFFSPYSIAAALAMAYEGARGQTADEMQSVLHFPENDIIRRSSYARIHNLINKKDKDYELYSANAFWAQNNYPFLQDYINTIEKYYAAEANNLDFVNNPEGSRETINSWVEEHTNDKIKDIIPPKAINALTRLVLTNAVYFKGDWVLKFDKKKTVDAPFKVNEEKEVTVKMMGLTGNKAKFNYAFIPEEELQIIELPYEGEELSMIILLPKEGSIEEFEEKLTAENLDSWKARMRETKIDVYMPKFEFETKYSLPQILTKMGMPTAFQWPGADFSGMDGTQDLFISDVIHQAYINVDEEGTEAAAATAVIVAMGMAMPNEFRADHPFIFMIQEKTAGGILFLGKVADPNKMN